MVDLFVTQWSKGENSYKPRQRFSIVTSFISKHSSACKTVVGKEDAGNKDPSFPNTVFCLSENNVNLCITIMSLTSTCL